MKFTYNLGRRAKRLSALYILFIVGLYVLVWFLGSDGYMHAWLFSLLTAVVALFVLSIPRYIKVDAEALEIHCVVEMTRIEIRDITSIRKIKRKDWKRIWPLLGSYGFFGYYGYYFDFKEWDMLKVYTAERKNLIEIEDIYEQRYIISCREGDKLINAVMQAKLLHAGKETVAEE